jgi:hypothetical protein
MYYFGTSTFSIRLHAFSGYHQIQLSAESMRENPFFAPRGQKYIWAIMPFSLCNCPVIFLSMMHHLGKLWTQLMAEYSIKDQDNKGTSIIMDDTLSKL